MSYFLLFLLILPGSVCWLTYVLIASIPSLMPSLFLGLGSVMARNQHTHEIFPVYTDGTGFQFAHFTHIIFSPNESASVSIAFPATVLIVAG